MKPEYFKAICKLAVHGAQNLPDETAGSMPELYPSYEWLVENNITVKRRRLFSVTEAGCSGQLKTIRNSTGRISLAKMAGSIFPKFNKERKVRA